LSLLTLTVGLPNYISRHPSIADDFHNAKQTGLNKVSMTIYMIKSNK